ncbi:MAG: hypothetical protein ABR548_01465 [Actinomycetota bacterium]|nr:hypothetical protein [Actinomycetota bacterium]
MGGIIAGIASYYRNFDKNTVSQLAADVCVKVRAISIEVVSGQRSASSAQRDLAALEDDARSVAAADASKEPLLRGLVMLLNGESPEQAAALVREGCSG